MSAGRENLKKSRFPHRKSIKLDPINPRDFRELNIIYCCEQCSFHNPGANVCTMGFYCKKHERKAQLETYDKTGKMAYCRFLEID
ncbi:MAG: hypothetical protein KDD61_08405 [Bdellovibrionales bacterium]|nr:hypothetical protein [Bdellovibrionales bacterium]